jgi:hypothetical protein
MKASRRIDQLAKAFGVVDSTKHGRMPWLTVSIAEVAQERPSHGIYAAYSGRIVELGVFGKIPRQTSTSVINLSAR